MDKQELKQTLGEVFNEKFDEKLEPFAAAIQGDIREFRNEFGKFRNEVSERFKRVEDDVSYVRHWTSMLDAQVEDIKQQLDKVVYRHELESLRERVEKLEKVVKSVKENNF